jgi:hypothetical protein
MVYHSENHGHVICVSIYAFSIHAAIRRNSTPAFKLESLVPRFNRLQYVRCVYAVYVLSGSSIFTPRPRTFAVQFLKRSGERKQETGKLQERIGLHPPQKLQERIVLHRPQKLQERIGLHRPQKLGAYSCFPGIKGNLCFWHIPFYSSQLSSSLLNVVI